MSEKVVFTEIFNDLDVVRTAIYGIGQTTQEILQQNPDLFIAGLYDRDLKNGEMYGKRILDIENIVSDNIQRIIIAAVPTSMKIVYERIENICKKNQIQLVDCHNRNLYDYYETIELYEQSYFELDEETLEKKIEQYDVISFDIFDTILMRKTFEPHDIFRIVERKAAKCGICVNEFCLKRIEAEQNLIKAIPNIYELYDELQRLTNISDCDKEALLKLELEVEANLIFKRDSICKIMEYAYQKGKKIYLISDMYIPKEILTKWLKIRNIVTYHEMFVSCEFHKPKVDGLYDIYRQQVEGSRFLHIGDNEIYDGVFAQNAGLDVFLIKSAVEMFRISSMKHIEKSMKTLDDRIIVGAMVAELFQNPFVLKKTMGRVPVEKIEIALAIGGSPIIIAFLLWFVDRISIEPCEGVILGARDGYLIHKMLDAYKKYHKTDLPKCWYFYVSRIACTIANVRTYEDFQQLIRRPKNSSLRQCLQERMDIYVDNDEEKEIYVKYEQCFVERSKQFFERYEKYMDSLGIQKNVKYLFFDFVSSGTCLGELQNHFDMKVKGEFFYRYYTKDKKRAHLDIDSFLDIGEGEMFWEYYLIFEAIMTSQESTFLYFDELLEPKFEGEKRSDEEKGIVDGIQACVIEFFEQVQYMEISNHITKELALECVRLLNGKAMYINDDRKEQLYLYDSYESGAIKIF